MPAALEPDRGSFEMAELLATVDAFGSVAVGLALDRRSEPAIVRYLTVTDHIAEGWRPRLWSYGTAVFIESEVLGAKVSEWLERRRGVVRVRAEDVAFAFDPLPESGRTERHPGQSNQDSEPLPVPYQRYGLGDRGSFNVMGSEPGWLVGTAAPAFPDADAALMAFFFDVWTPGQSATHEVVVARISTPGPRIADLEFAPGELTVSIEDDSTSSRRQVPLRLDLAIGEHRSAAEILEAPWTATLNLPEGGASQYWWLVLSEGHRWLDRRSADGLAKSEGNISRASLEPDDEVAAWINIGECGFLEFKSELPAPSGNAKACRTVAAFANGRGGTIVFGIDPDEATISAINERYDLARDRLTNIIEGNLTEVPPFEIRRLETKAGLVIAVEIGTGESPPYGVDKRKPVFYIRSNATTLPATAEQVRRLSRSSTHDQSSRGFPHA
jgi:hypothetical protein